MKRLVTVLAFALVCALYFGPSVSALVTNGSFEAGTFSGWTKSSFINNGISQPQAAGGSDLSAIVGGPGVMPLSLSDPRTNNNLRYPAYGSYSARINSELSSSGGGFPRNGNKIQQTLPAYVDPSDGLAHVKFTYAAVMVNPAHAVDAQPHFRVRVTNQSNGNDILHDFQSYVGEPGKNWQNGAPTWQYLDWTLIDLKSSPAHPVNPLDSILIEIIAAGCSLGGHPGYVYVDEITDNEVAGPTVQATGPSTTGSGSPITYTYNYRNGSTQTINPTITAAQPTGVVFGSVSDAVNCSLSAGTVTCNYSNLAAGATGLFTVTGTVTAANGTTVAHGAYQIAATGFPTLGGQTVLTTVTTSSTATAITSSANPSVSGQNATLTATVTSAGGTPTGTVQFTVGGVNYGAPVALSGGMAQLSTAGFPVGANNVQAIYSPDPSFSGSTSPVFVQTVNPANSNVAVTTSPNPAVTGQGFTITANVTAVAPGTGTPTGTVTFYVDGLPVCTAVVLASGQATCNAPGMPAGNHVVTATYSGNGNFNGSTGTQTGGTTVNPADTTLGLTASPNPSVSGQSVTVTATVAPVAPGAGMPTGTVTFSVNGSPVCTNVVMAGALATCNLPNQNAGNHTVTATYGGDPNFNGSNGSLIGGLTVNPANTTLGLTASPNPSVTGQGVTVTATVAPVAPATGTPTGTVTFSVNGTIVCLNVPLVAGVATCNLPSQFVGNHTVTATYGGSPNYNGSNGMVAGGLTVNPANTTTAVASSVNPSVSGQSVTFTATVSPVSPGTGTPTGTVTFSIDGSPVCTNAAMTGNQATCSSSNFNAGNHSVSATYNGDANYNSSTGSLVGGQGVVAATTATAVASSVNPSVTGQSVTFTATVTTVAPGSGTPTGTATFSVDGSPVCVNAAMTAGVATCTSSNFTAGTHPVSVTYNGSANSNTSTGTLSGGQVVNAASTSTAVASSVNPSVTGQSVTFTATVSSNAPGSGTPTGTVTFSVDGSPVCTNAAMTAGVATCISSAFNAGTHPVSATYNADANYNTSTGSLAGGQVVDKANTTTAVSASANPAVFGQTVTFTANVTANAPGAGTPTGNITFVVDGNALCAAAVMSGGSATCSTASLSVGNHTVSATYDSDANFNGSNGSLAGGQSVGKADTTTVVTGSQNPSVYGQPVTFTATVAPVAPGVGTPSGTLSFNFDGNILCSNVTMSAAQATCTVSSLEAGDHVVVAVYSGDNNFNVSAGTLTGGPFAVTKADSVTVITNVAQLGSPSHVGEAYPVNWDVSLVAPGAGTPTGNVTVSEGSASCTAAAMAQTCSLTSTTPGTKTITVSYAGNSNVNPSAAAPASHLVNVMVSGRVQRFVNGGSNTDMSGVTVTLSGSATATVTTDSNGRFTFSHLAGGGNYVVAPAASGVVFDPVSRTYNNLNTNAMNANFIGYDAPVGPRDLRAINQYLVPGDDVIIPLNLKGRGNEMEMSFSLNYASNPLKMAEVTCGSDAPGCSINADPSNPGQLGVTVTFATPPATGDREVVRVRFRSHGNISVSNSLITFGDAPMVKSSWDVDANPLATTYTDGAVVFARGMESDVGGRFTGDGELHTNDLVLVRNFVVANAMPHELFNEFQRADAAPAVTKGDGMLDATDIVQARRFISGLDASTTPGGPYRNIAQPASVQRMSENGRALKIGDGTVYGREVSVPVSMIGNGDEVAVSFTLNFDESRLTNPRVTLADGSDAVLTFDTTNLGRVAVLVDSATPLTYAKSERQLLTVTFDVAVKSRGGVTSVSFSNDSTPSVVSDAFGAKLEASFTDGKVELSGAANVDTSVSGRVQTPDGSGLRNAQVILTDAKGNTRTATTGSFGYYSFDSLPISGQFTLSVVSKRYTFDTRTVTTSGDRANVDLVARN